MHNRARIVAPILLVALLAGGGLWWWNRSASAAAAAQLSGSGTIEAEDVLVTSEVSGRVQALLVDEGQEVTAGQRLGLSGSTGRVTGPHLHLAVRWQGLYLDPASLLALALA